MTTKLTVLASIVLLTVASAASAQQAAAVPAQKAIPMPHIELPRVEFPHVEFPQIELPDLHLDLEGLRDSVAMAQQVAQGVQPFNNFKFQEHSQVESQYSQARQRIDSNQYDRALEPLDRVINAKGERADAALYWKAYSLMKLARRDEALSTLGQLTKQFPDSPWVRDARALEVEVKQASGQNAATDAVDDETKLLALNAIMRTDPDRALAAVEKMLAGSSNVRLKDRALIVLSQSRSEKAVGLISNVARTNTNPDLQQKAIRYLGQSNSAEAMTTLSTVYRGSNSTDTKRAVVSSLASSRNPGAVTALVALARAERNTELKNLILRHLDNSNSMKSPEVKALMEEIIAK